MKFILLVSMLWSHLNMNNENSTGSSIGSPDPRSWINTDSALCELEKGGPSAHIPF